MTTYRTVTGLSVVPGSCRGSGRRPSSWDRLGEGFCLTCRRWIALSPNRASLGRHDTCPEAAVPEALVDLGVRAFGYSIAAWRAARPQDIPRQRGPRG